MNIKNNINNFRQNLPPGCKLVAVSKTNPVEKIQEAYAAGQRCFGENKVQELISKRENLPQDIEWHMIGHLQSNKVKFIAPFVSLIHSVDSLKLLKEIDKQASSVNRTINCLLQVHIATEETKFGFSEVEVTELLCGVDLKKLQHIKVIGLMGMASLTEDVQQVRSEFTRLKDFFERIKTFDLPASVVMQELSMGMTSDYALAIAAGSTMIRVGSAIFGERTSRI